MRTLARFVTFAGVLSLAGGVLAILNPLLATIAAVTLAAAALLLSGVVQLVGAFAEPSWRARLPSLLLAVAVLALGVAVVRHPAAGVTALTLLLAFLFLLSGISKLGWSVMHRRESSFWPLVVSGGLSLLLAWLVWSNVQSGRSDIIGTFLGVELMLNGVALLAVGALGRRVVDRLKGA